MNSTDTEEELRAVAYENDRQVLEYFEVNGMAPNRAKTEALSVLNRFSRPVRVGEIESQKEIKLLGICMTEKMSFLPQALEVVRKVTAKLPSVLRLKEWASRELLVNTATSLLMSHISYGLQTYGGESRVLTLLQRCQNRVMRALLGKQLTDRVPIASMLAEIGWNSVSNMMRYQSVFIMRKVDRLRIAPFTAKLLCTGANTTYNRRKRQLDVDFISKTLVTANNALHRSLELYNRLNLYTDGVQLKEFKEVIESRILSIWPNGNY